MMELWAYHVLQVLHIEVAEEPYLDLPKVQVLDLFLVVLELFQLFPGQLK
jgi:hypothetical protein